MKSTSSPSVAEIQPLSARDYPLLGEAIVVSCRYFHLTTEENILGEGQEIQKRIAAVIETTPSDQLSSLQEEVINLISFSGLPETLRKNLLSPRLFKLLGINKDDIRENSVLRELQQKYQDRFQNILQFIEQ